MFSLIRDSFELPSSTSFFGSVNNRTDHCAIVYTDSWLRVHTPFHTLRMKRTSRLLYQAS